MADDEYIIDNYQLLNCVATGNYTQIWEAIAKGGTNHLAMKLMLKEAFTDSEQRSVFKHETKVAKTLEHPSIIRCQEVVFTKKHAYMLMDYFPAPNLKAQIGANIAELQARLRKLIEQICLGLAYIHEKGWVHRDIKPDNILCNKSSEVRLIDFSLCCGYARGIAKAFAGKQKIIQGTRTYIAPETVMKQVVSPQTDIYSLGITIFEALTGVPPFFGSSPGDLLVKHVRNVPPLASELNPNVAPEMDALVAKMLKKKPKDRQQSVMELASEIRNVKMFKVDPKELEDQRKKEAHEKQLQILDKAHRLDSRSDALRSELRSKDPNPAKPTKTTEPPAPAPARPVAKPAPGKGAGTVEQKPTAPPAVAQPAAAQPAPAPAPFYPQPPMGYPPPMGPPGYPQYYPPAGYPQPPYPMPPQYQPQPGYPPPQYAPGMPYPYPPGVAPYPQGAAPPFQHAPYPMSPAGPAAHGAPVMPAQQQPAGAPQSRAPQSSPAARSAPAAAAAAAVPLMEELPPIKTEKKPKEELPLMDDLPPVV
ncbi:MAG: serine/threonine-protein kinase [Planctomycetaceae bacterium]